MDSYANFVFAVDTTGQLGVFLIDEDDPENDDETMQVHVKELNQPPIAMYIYPDMTDSNQMSLAGELVIVT